MMQLKMKKKWLKALRSGKYTQGLCALKTIAEKKKASFCCLGVLCDINRKEFTMESARYKNKETVFSADGLSSSSEIPGTIATEFLGAESKNRELNSTEEIQEELAGMNDGGASFKSIANWIEENL